LTAGRGIDSFGCKRAAGDTAMTLRAAVAIILGGATLLLAAPAAADGGAVAPECDRSCLVRTMDQYVAALVRHDPAGLPLERDARFTENTVPLRIGKEGLWVSASQPPSAFRIYAADPSTGAVGLMTLMQAWGKPVIVALRLKVVNGRITQIEHVVTTNAIRPAALANLTTPRPEFLADVAPAERSERHKLVNITDSYFEAVEHADGSLAPFAAHCVRRENGMQTTSNSPPKPWPVPLGSKEADAAMAYIGSLNCDAQLDTHVMDYIGRLWPRRYEVVDVEKGLVFAFPMFQHPGKAAPVPVVGVPGVTSLPLGRSSSNMQAGEIFKIVGGKIVSVEAMGAFLPYGTKSGWIE
jgi:hypothetical protein